MAFVNLQFIQYIHNTRHRCYTTVGVARWWLRVFPSITTFAIYLHVIKVEVYNNYAIVSSWQVEWKKSWFGVIYTYI